MLVAAPLFDAAKDVDAGRIEVFLGSADGLPTNPSFTLEGLDGAGAQLGYSVAAAGDVNGDGLGDFIVSAPFANSGSITGAGLFFCFRPNLA